MGSRSEQTILEVLAKTVVDCERNHERSDSRSDADNGYRSYHSDDRLPALGPEISRGDEELECHSMRE
jgi:hypothetical protein